MIACDFFTRNVVDTFENIKCENLKNKQNKCENLLSEFLHIFKETLL